MPISFPSSPSLNQQYTSAGRTWYWNGSIWQSLGTAQGLTGTQGAQGLNGAFAAQGVQGPLGVQGTIGAQGLNGAFAAQGIQGPVGVQGIVGAATYDSDQGILSQQVFS